MVSTGTQTKTPPQDKANQTEPQPDPLHQQQLTHHPFPRGLSHIPETSPSHSSNNNSDALPAQFIPPNACSVLESENSGITGLPASIPAQATFLQRLAGVASQHPQGRSVSSLDDSLSQHTLRHHHAGIPGHRNVPESHTSGENAEESKGYASGTAWVANTAATIPYPAGAAALYRPHTTNSSAPPSTQGALLQGLSIEALHRERLRRRQQQDQSDLPGLMAGLPTVLPAHSKRHFLSPSKAYGATSDLNSGRAPMQAAFTAHLETPSAGLQTYSQSILGSWSQRRGPDQYPTGGLQSRNPILWDVAAAVDLSSAQVNFEPSTGYTPFTNSSPGFTEPAAKRLRSDWPSTAAYNNQAPAFSVGAPDPPGMFGTHPEGRDALQPPLQMHVGNTIQQQQSYLSHMRSLVNSNHHQHHVAPSSTVTAGVIGLNFSHMHGQGLPANFAAFPQHLLPPSLMKAANAPSVWEQENESRNGMLVANVHNMQTITRPVLQSSQMHAQQPDLNQQGLQQQQQYIKQQQTQQHWQGYQQHSLEQQPLPHVQGHYQSQQQNQQQQQKEEDLRLLHLLSQNTLLQLQQQPLDPQMDELLQLLREGEMWGAQSASAQPGTDQVLGQRMWQPPPSETSEMLNRYLHE